MNPSASRPPRRPQPSHSLERQALLASVLLASGLAGCGDPALDARTVLFISIDTARADTVRFDDPATTPNMTRLAERGVVFDQAVTGTSWTLPSHVQMFTGQDPLIHGVNFDDVRLDPRTPTLPQLFDEAGWFTAGVFSGWYLIKDYGFGRGFDLYENGMPGGTGFERELRAAAEIGDLARRSETMDEIWMRADRVSHEAITSPSVVDKAIGAIDAAGEEDLFLFVHLFDPHYDYIPPDDVAERFDPDYQGTMTGHNFYRNRAVYDRSRGGRQISDRDLEHIRALYRGEVYFTDDYIGRLLEYLEDVGRMDNTFVVVVGDHGEEFFEHGNRGHRATLFEEQLRVPMLMVPPDDLEGADRDRVVTAQTSLSDVAPTLLEYAGLEFGHVTGRSLVAALRGDSFESRPERAYLKPFPDVKMQGQGDGRGVAGVYHHFLESWRTPDAKFTRHFVYRTAEQELITKEAWFSDLANDPLEQQLIADPQDERFVAGWNQLEALNESARATIASLARAPLDQRVTLASDMLGGVLEALGYADGVADTAEEGDESGIPQASYELPWGLDAPPPIALEDYIEQRLRR